MNKLKYSLKPETVLIFHFLWNCIFYYCYYCDLNVLIFLQFWQIAWAAYLILSTHHHIINMINIRFSFVFKNNQKWMLTAWASNIVFVFFLFILKQSKQKYLIIIRETVSWVVTATLEISLTMPSLKSHVTYFYAVPADDVKSLF